MNDWNALIFSDDRPFGEKVERVFEYQYEHNPVYRRFCDALSMDLSPGNPPLLPIRAFKDAEITCRPGSEPEVVFESSGTSGMERSRHLVADAEQYRQSVIRGFRQFYDLDRAVIWAYVPGYSENPNSSLVWMLNELVKQDASGMSRFLELDAPLDKGAVKQAGQSGRQLILFGAAFGLLDLVDMGGAGLPDNALVIETGGMKTRRKEITRGEMHNKLAGGFGLHTTRIHSEYGMAEMLSQAYATGGKWFRCVPWLKVSVRNPDNPMEELPPHAEGKIGVMDLANVHSCSFLLTGDRGVMDNEGRFQVLGRWNPRDLRGCNFLIGED